MEWFSQKTSIAGTPIPNWALVLGAVIIIGSATDYSSERARFKPRHF